MRQLPLGVMLRANAVFANFAPGANAEILAALEGAGRGSGVVMGEPGLRQDAPAASGMRGGRRTCGVLPAFGSLGTAGGPAGPR